MIPINHTWDYAWHRALNVFNEQEHHSWMYLAKEAAHELPRLTRLFEMERTGQLPQVHQQCSHSQSVPVANNHLSCCLGATCKECPFLRALETQTMTAEQQDAAKAFTCVTHILTEVASRRAADCGHIDTSEGFILTVDDRMYWDTVYAHLSAADPDAAEFSQAKAHGENQ